MEKEYNHNLENSETNKVSEPVLEYGLEVEMEILPALTKEELEDTITRDELLEYIFEKIDKLPGK